MELGVSYYPEQRDDPRQIEEEVRLMAEAGLGFARMGEFAWCRFEPEEDRYEFAWLDQAIEKLGAAGIKTIVCTPTACPPAWLFEKLPDMRYVDNRGRTRPFGGRRHYCYTHSGYREYSRRIAAALGRQYAGNPDVIGFQIDNELAQEGTGRCHCPACAAAFRSWLERKYGSVAELNRRWGTIFWGQEYDRFDQVPLPATTIEPNSVSDMPAFYDNPSLRLDFELFSSQSLTEYQDIQARALREAGAKMVTSNATGIATNSIDYYRSFAGLDRYGFDLYPSLRHGRIDSFQYAHARGVKGAPFWVLEFTSGGGHRLSGSGRLQPFPGALKLATMQAFAHGCELLAYFQFRAFLAGAEQLNYAILDADGIPRRRYAEMKEAAAEIKRLTPYLAESHIESDVAICFDYRVLWALRIKPVNVDFDYLDWCRELYDALRSLGRSADVVSYDADLSRYKLVVLPSAFLMDEGMKARVEDFVSKGGTLFATFLCAVKNFDNAASRESLPAGLTELFGIRVAEVEPVFPDTVCEVSIGGESKWKSAYWLEELEGLGASFPGRYTTSFRAGRGALSRNALGAGAAWYLGVGLKGEALAEALRAAAEEAGTWALPFELPAEVDAVSRRLGEKDTYFVLNFQGNAVSIHSSVDLRSLGGDGPWSRTISLGPKGYAILETR
jgi:Beta-galactosidase